LRPFENSWHGTRRTDGHYCRQAPGHFLKPDDMSNPELGKQEALVSNAYQVTLNNVEDFDAE
jgi:hypothetical protein